MDQNHLLLLRYKDSSFSMSRTRETGSFFLLMMDGSSRDCGISLCFLRYSRDAMEYCSFMEARNVDVTGSRERVDAKSVSEAISPSKIDG